jgi:hypothetical protein
MEFQDVLRHGVWSEPFSRGRFRMQLCTGCCGWRGGHPARGTLSRWNSWWSGPRRSGGALRQRPGVVAMIYAASGLAALGTISIVRRQVFSPAAQLLLRPALVSE